MEGESDKTDSSSSWHVLLLNISKELMRENLKSLKFYFSHEYKGQIVSQEVEDAQTGIDLLSSLSKWNLLGQTNTNILIEALESASCKDLARKIRDFSKSHASQSQHSNSDADDQKSFCAPCNITDDMVVKHFKETELSKNLEELMSSTDVVVISGLLGSGKSQMALQYGRSFRRKSESSLSWKVNAKDKTSLSTSLKNLAENLYIDFKKTEKEDVEDINHLIKRLVQLINQCLTRMNPGKHLIVIDDVGQDCEDVIESVVDGICEGDNTKCIVTTYNTLILQDRQHLESVGFTETESIEFLIGDRNFISISTDEKKAYADLAMKMSFLPLGLHGARTYMKNTKIGPTRLAKYLNQDKLQKIETKLIDSSVMKSLFSALQIFLDILKKDLDTEAYQMFQMTQFLDTEDIPVTLFDGLCLSDESEEEMDLSLSTNALVEALQKFSFGSVRGFDDDRTFSTHLAVSLTLQACTPREDKKKLFLKLLRVFASLMDKDNMHRDDYKRIVSLLPHAKRALSYAEEVLGNPLDLESEILLVYLYDVVGYTYNFEWLSDMEKFHSDKAKSSCYRLLNSTEDKIDNEVKKSISGSDDKSIECFEKSAWTKAQIIVSKLDKIVHDNRKVLSDVVRTYVLHKRRSKEDLERFAKMLNKPVTEYMFTETEFKELCDRKFALPIDKITEFFLHELVLQVFYTLGRRVYYLPKDTELATRRYFCHYLFVAAELAETISNRYPTFLPLYTMLAFRNGRLELCFEDKLDLGLRSITRLQSTAKVYKNLLEEEGSYYIFGVFKMSPKEDLHHTAVCYKQLLRCYQTMVEIEDDPEKKNVTKDEGCKVAENLLKKCESMSDRLSLPGFHVRTAEFFLCLEKLTDAETLFQMVCPKDLLDDHTEVIQKVLSKHERLSLYGMKECLVKTGRRQKALNMLTRTLRKLPNTEHKERAVIQKHISELSNEGLPPCDGE